MPINDHSLSDWMYGTDLEDEYQAGRTLQSCDPSQSDWLSNLKLDLRAASARRKTVHCIVANTDTWYSRHAGISRCLPFFFLFLLFFCHSTYVLVLITQICLLVCSNREVQVLTCVEEETIPPRTKQYWVPVTMSGQVAALVESTQLLWLMMRDAEQVRILSFF